MLTLHAPSLRAPCPRPESRGRLLSLAIRRSEDEVLLIGFRSAPHWQARPKGARWGWAGRSGKIPVPLQPNITCCLHGTQPSVHASCALPFFSDTVLCRCLARPAGRERGGRPAGAGAEQAQRARPHCGACSAQPQHRWGLAGSWTDGCQLAHGLVWRVCAPSAAMASSPLPVEQNSRLRSCCLLRRMSRVARRPGSLLTPSCCPPLSRHPAGQWADHRGTLDFNLLKGDWPDALPAPDGGGFPRWVQPAAAGPAQAHMPAASCSACPRLAPPIAQRCSPALLAAGR